MTTGSCGLQNAMRGSSKRALPNIVSNCSIQLYDEHVSSTRCLLISLPRVVGLRKLSVSPTLMMLFEAQPNARDANDPDRDVSFLLDARICDFDRRKAACRPRLLI